MTGAVATHGHITCSSKKLKSLTSPQRRQGVGEPELGSSMTGTWSKGWRVAGGWMTPGDDRWAGGPVDDAWLQADDSGWRRVGGRGRTTTAGRRRRAWPWTDGRPRAWAWARHRRGVSGRGAEEDGHRQGALACGGGRAPPGAPEVVTGIAEGSWRGRAPRVNSVAEQRWRAHGSGAAARSVCQRERGRGTRGIFSISQ
jgi:hypothetical protein